MPRSPVGSFSLTSGEAPKRGRSTTPKLECRPSQFSTTAHLVEDNVGGGLPGERFGRVVPACKPRTDGVFQFLHRGKGAAPNHFVRDEPKPPFHLIEPGTVGVKWK